MSPSAPTAASELYELAYAKMSRVLGESRAQELIALICEKQRVTLATADELMTFARELNAMGGFEGAVGALLSVLAVMRGARG